MSTLLTIQNTDIPTNSRAVINDNFNALNTDKEEVSNKSTDSTFASADDTTYPTTLATKKYVDAGGNVNASTTGKGIVEEATQAEVDAGTATGGTGARLFINPSASPKAKFPASSAFSGTSPTSFTDLDLSSIVGTASRVVLLKVTNGTTTVAFHFRKNGEAGSPPVGATGSHASRTSEITSGQIAYVITVTDSAGIVEWMSTQTGVGSSSTTTTVTVEAYW